MRLRLLYSVVHMYKRGTNCLFPDVAIGAPYACQSPDRSHPVSLCAGQNSGAVYIYYGRANLSEFESQTPFKVGFFVFQDTRLYLIGCTLSP